MRQHLRTMLVLLVMAIFISGAAGGWYLIQRNARLVHVGDHRIDPLAKIQPERRYDIVVWESDLFIPGLESTRRRAALEEAAAELSAIYPNITVTFEYMDFGPDYNRLQEALTAGVGPDIAGLHAPGLLLDPTRQVPITPYIPEEVYTDLLPSVISAVTHAGHLWVWPRWISLTTWLGTYERLKDVPHRPALRQADLLTSGPDWRRALGNHPPIVYNALDSAFFAGLVVANTGYGMLSPEGSLQWTEADLEQTAALLHDLLAAGLMSSDAATVARTRLSNFWTNRAAVMAPVNPALLHHAVSRAGDLTHAENDALRADEAPKLTIVSAPFAGDHLAGAPGHVAGYAVFVREQHAGDDHTAAAMLVARHLSQRAGYWEAATMLTVPAYTSSLAGWEHDVGLQAEQVRALIELAVHLVPPSVERGAALREADALSAAVLPHVLRLLKGELTPREFAAAATRDLNAFLSSHAGKPLAQVAQDVI